MTSVKCISEKKMIVYILSIQASVIILLTGCGEFTNFSYESFDSSLGEGKTQEEQLLILEDLFDQASQEDFYNESQIITDSLNKQGEVEKENMIKIERKCGLDNPILLDYYAEEIRDVNDLTDSKCIWIDSYYADLNADGLIDALIILDSVLHSGSAGLRFEILVNNGDGTYREVFRTRMRISNFSAANEPEPIDEFFISLNSTNGFFDIYIIRDEIVIARLSNIDDVYVVVYGNENALGEWEGMETMLKG